MTPIEKIIEVVFFRTESGNEPVREWIQSLPKSEKKVIGEDIRTVEFDYPIGLPLIGKIEKSLWEVRSKFKDGIARVIFTIYDKKMILLHGFKKKTQKLSGHDLHLARQRLKEHMSKRKK